jgi:DNA (cytosine-5)-methyltransferase 1
MKKQRIRYVDLFAGIGGFRSAITQLSDVIDPQCVFTSEIDKYARRTYESWYLSDVDPEERERVFKGDITAVDAKEIDSHDLLMGGFPCQPFSRAGKRKGFADTRGTLFFDIERIVEAHTPKYVLLENVKGLRSHDGGLTLRVIHDRLEKLGYEVACAVLNARDFGVPQNRERLFIVGILPRVGVSSFQFPEGDGNGRDSVELREKLETRMSNNRLGEFQISERLWAGHQRRREEHKKKGNGFGYSLFERGAPYVNTISARYYKDGSEVLIAVRSQRPRKITPKEGLNLQGFPSELQFPPGVSNTQAYKQIGNAVAVPVVRHILRNMFIAGGDLAR